MKRSLSPILAVAAAWMFGCATPTAFQSARTLEPDVAQVGVALESFRGSDAMAFGGESGEVPVRTQPELEVFARKGMNDWSDCGGRIFSFGAKLDCKVQVLRTRRVDFAVAPGVGYTTSFLTAHILDGYLQALAAVNLGEEPFQPGGVSLIGSITPIGRCFVSEGNPGQGCFGQLAYSGALAIQITRDLGFHGEVAWMRSPWPVPPNFGTIADPFWQFGLAVTWRVPPKARHGSVR